MLPLFAQADVVDSGVLSQFQAFFTFITTHWQFCLLHFLEFAVWGAWFVVLGNLLNARGFARKDIGRIYACIPIGSMITPLLIGALADKYFNTEVIIGVSHLIGGVLLFMMAKTATPRKFYWLTLLYALAFAPTLTLVNTMVFAHDADIFGGAADEGFPWVRVFGTLGWIAAGLSHAVLLKKDEPVNEKPLVLAAVLSVILGVFAFTLPATPPANAAAEATATTGELALVDGVQPEAVTENMGIIEGSFSMLTSHPVFFAVTFVAAMAMGLYFAFAALFVEKTGVPARTVGPVMTIGQWIEIFFIVTLPYFLGSKNANMNWVLLIGLSAWALRFAMFAVGRPMALVLLGIAMHGICFDFFFVAGFINVDAIAPEGLTATAQALYGFLVYGLGMYLGSEGSGWLNQHFSKTTTGSDGEEVVDTNWRAFWAVPCVIVAIGALVYLATNLM